MPPETADARLPEPPEALLAFLRDAESRLDDLRFEIRSVREALEAEPRPSASSVAAAVPITGTVHATLPSLTATATGTGSGTFGWTGSATGHAPPVEVSSWLDKVKKHGPAGARVVEFIVRVWSSLN